MKVMQPTCKLRFVKRQITVPFQGSANVSERKDVTILQQWWGEVDVFGATQGDGEWRDIPLGVEE
jgi:hypothetical protein